MTIELALGPNEIEHDGEEGGGLMRRNWGQNQKTSVEPKHEADKLGVHVEEKASALTMDRWGKKKPNIFAKFVLSYFIKNSQAIASFCVCYFNC